jgi:hypothetical protein
MSVADSSGHLKSIKGIILRVIGLRGATRSTSVHISSAPSSTKLGESSVGSSRSAAPIMSICLTPVARHRSVSVLVAVLRCCRDL